MAGPVNPLLPDIITPEESAEVLQKTAAVAAVLIAARLAPQTVAPVLRYGAGVVIAKDTGAVTGVTPLAITNVLPFPFGYFSPQFYGLAPNYYIPAGTSGKSLPEFLPGVKEQRAEFAARTAPPDPTPTRRAQQLATAQLASMTVPQLEAARQRQKPFNFAFPGFTPEQTVEAVQSELNRRAAQRIAPVSSPPTPGPPNLGPELGPTPGRQPQPRPSAFQLGTTSPSVESAEGHRPIAPGTLTTSQLQDAVVAQLNTIQHILHPGAATSQVELERAQLLLGDLQAQLASRLAPAPRAVDITAPPPRAGIVLGSGPAASPSPGLPVAPGGPGGPAIGPIGPVLPGAGSTVPLVPVPPRPSVSPSPGLPVGPLIPPIEETPGSTPGQPRWPPRWPNPGNPFPDKFMEVAHGDP